MNNASSSPSARSLTNPVKSEESLQVLQGNIVTLSSFATCDTLLQQIIPHYPGNILNFPSDNQDEKKHGVVRHVFIITRRLIAD